MADKKRKVAPSPGSTSKHLQINCGKCNKKMRRDELNSHFLAKHSGIAPFESGCQSLTDMFARRRESLEQASTDNDVHPSQSEEPVANPSPTPDQLTEFMKFVAEIITRSYKECIVETMCK